MKPILKNLLYIFLFTLVLFILTQKVNAITTIYQCTVDIINFNEVSNLRLNDKSLEPDIAYYYLYLNLAIENRR